MMRVYAMLDGVRHAADVADGAIQLEVGACDDGAGGKLPPIAHIDWRAETYRRHGGEAMPIPNNFWRSGSVKWSPVTEDQQESRP